MKISLKEEMETLLIPLYGRAVMSKKGIFKDTDAELAVMKLDYDFSRLRIQEKTQVMLSVRGAIIDDFTRRFIGENRECTVLYLGCGLDARAKRLGFPAALWYDLDFPEVIDIKRELYGESDRYGYIPSSVTDWKWMDGVCPTGPVLVIAEGLLMYLKDQDVKTLLLKLRDKFGDVTMIFDAYSKFTAAHAGRHPSLKKTGAEIRWGADSPEEIEAFGNGIRHQKTLYFTDKGALGALPFGYRLTFEIAGKFRAAREAHRVFIMKLVT